MALFRKRPEQSATAPPTIAESLGMLVQSAGQPSLFAHSEFVKQVDCPRCGAPKRLPSKTAYLYCDHCGSLVDYDFRLANSGTSAGLTNTVYHHLVAPVQGELDQARAAGDTDRYRELLRGVFAEWIRQCPQAVSPRARADQGFRDRMVGYLVECAVRRDFAPDLAVLDRQMNAAIASLQRRPNAAGPWLISDGIWQVAALFKQQMELAYQMLEAVGVLAMDPDEAPPGVPLSMEYSTFCQGWIPHLLPSDGERLLAMFGLTGQYARVNVTDAVTRRCGGCGDELKTVPEANAVVCESCGRKLDIAGGETPCHTCGAPLSFPVGISRLECPYCHSGTHRVRSRCADTHAPVGVRARRGRELAGCRSVRSSRLRRPCVRHYQYPRWYHGKHDTRSDIPAMQSGLIARDQPPAALILAAGESRRFWPLSGTQHKSLFRLAGVSLLERTIGSLVKAGVKEIVVVQSPRSLYSKSGNAVLPSDCLPSDCGDARLTFVEQPTPAGQGDAILRCAHLLGDSFFVVQPENINAGDISAELMESAEAGDIAVVAGQERADFSLYAVLHHREQRLTGISEKPMSAGCPRPLCSMGIYLFHSTFTRHLADHEPDPLSIIRALDQVAKTGKASVARSRNEFLPLKYPGHLWAYARFLDLASAPAAGPAGDVVNGAGYRADHGGCIVSEDCTLGADVSLYNAILAPGVAIGSGTEIMNGGEWHDLDAVVIGQGATVGTNVTLAPRVRIGVGATIASGLRIDSDVPDMTTVN